ncbi:MAG: EFR1 family ferrodoxin [Bacilli bacterium]
MKKLIIYVFSGTGNTLKIASLYQDYLKDEYQTQIYLIDGENENIPSPHDFDLIGLGYPIHAFNAPEIFCDFLKKLPNSDKPVFIFKSSGEGLHLNDCSSQKSIGILEKKGYQVFMERHYVMPYNMIFRHNDPMVKQMWIYAKAMAKLNCREILRGDKEKVRIGVLRKWYAPLFRIEWIYAKLQGPFMKVDSKKCIGCNKCIDNCPTHNIDMRNGKIRFHNKCTLCVRCSFNCPTSAISIGLLNGWKVNGQYPIEELANDENLTFPYIGKEDKGVYKMYRKYYSECNQKLKAAGMLDEVKEKEA